MPEMAPQGAEIRGFDTIILCYSLIFPSRTVLNPTYIPIGRWVMRGNSGNNTLRIVETRITTILTSLPDYIGVRDSSEQEYPTLGGVKRWEMAGINTPGMWDLGLFCSGVENPSLSSGVKFRNVLDRFEHPMFMTRRGERSSLRRVVNTVHHPRV